RGGDGAAARAAPRGLDDLHGDARSALRALRAALGAPVRRARGEREGGRVMQNFLQDLRIGWRGLMRTPGFTARVLLVMALGIGTNTMIFNLVNTLLVRSTPYMDARRNVMIWSYDKFAGGARDHFDNFSYPDFMDLRQRVHKLESVAAWWQ